MIPMYSTSALPALAGSALLAGILVALAALVYVRCSGPRPRWTSARLDRQQAVIAVWLVMVAGLGLVYAHWHDSESLAVTMASLAVLGGLIVVWWRDGRR